MPQVLVPSRRFYEGDVQFLTMILQSRQSNLGVMHQNGQGVPQNFKEALRWYTKAAKQGQAGAQSNLGNMHWDGRGVPQNFKEALRWFTKAAEQGDAQAQSNLGALYANGEGGIKQDLTRALKWFRLAAAQGHETAKAAVPQAEAMLKASLGVTPPAKQRPALTPDACANCGILGESVGVKLNSCSRCKAVKYLIN